MKVKSLLDFKDKCQAMTEEQSRDFVMCFLEENQDKKMSEEAMSKLENDFSYKLMSKRLKMAKVPVSIWALLFLTTLCNSPGKLVMYAYVCCIIFKKNGRGVTIQDLAEEFPVGFPTEDATRECWDSQKGLEHGIKNVDNLLDTREPWM